MWRVYLDPNTATSLEEIDRHWDLLDVADANEALDVAEDVAAWQRTIRDAEQARDKAIRAAMG